MIDFKLFEGFQTTDRWTNKQTNGRPNIDDCRVAFGAEKSIRSYFILPRTWKLRIAMIRMNVCKTLMLTINLNITVY